ncbi:uncharacterized protein F4807DRAFT_40347 [Annulohypoxylon truncatum]|uniref:uncharacterized protein n=1 Tax=Annulohypoxylon truncatum TaxID=327061 RepID=UPI002007761C|nr:uncharacterized protein F4807DRAFT_40347 [Annulohypoxylon truncatum]KAI1210828.1 hypothetical protein F4807DRAFT_40347 [Annulohypoxylon truncatum]
MPPKRKRNERPSDAGANRPAPHRPSDTNLGQHDRDFQDTSTQNRRAPSGRNTRRSNNNNNNDRRDSSGSQLGANPNHRAPISPSTVRPSSSSSQVAAPAPAIPSTPTAPQPSQTQALSQLPTPSTYKFAILTEARLNTWQQKGRQEVVDHGIKSRNDEDFEEISTISQEFIRAVLEGRLNPADAGNCMKQILGPPIENSDDSAFGFNPQALFLDSLSIFLDSDDSTSLPQLRDFVSVTEISPRLLRDVLDAQALKQLGLIRDTFVKLGIRYATNQLYRQANYNLLREESEGYSKLAAELYRTPICGAREGHDFVLVQASWERVKGLIGTFDLDVGRVLDVVIDVFSATMLRTIVFFSRFLRISSWWPRTQVEHSERVFTGGLPKWALPQFEDVPIAELQAQLAEECYRRDLEFWDRARELHLDAFFELGGRRVEDINQSYSTEAKSSDSSIDWVRITKTLPPCGNKIAAQLLGFKFRFYASDARDKKEKIPANLYYLAAFLIKIGFISLADLYPHLWPDDSQMESLRERRMQELDEKERAKRQGNVPNALLAAGALTDDTLPFPSKPRESAATNADGKQQEAKADDEEEELPLPEPEEAHKADLVSHLLVVGALPEALFILGRFPWLPEAYPDEIFPAVNRILLHSISKVFNDTRPVEVRPITSSPIKPEVAQDQSGMTKGNLKLTEGAPIKILKWPHADGINKGTLYRFYLDEWADNVPICQTVDDVFTLCSTFLNISGVNIGREPSLVKKLAAIGVKSFLQDQSPENTSRWQDLLRRTLVPSLCLSDSNVDAVDAVWDLLKNYPTQVRYNIYSECYEGQISRLPAMSRAFKNARLDTLATLKRLSLQNISSSAKKLAKVALSSPGIVCKVALDQIEAYTNLIEAFVECTKYFTEMGHDVLVWSLLSSLGGKQRSRTQATSVLLTSRWLQALSKFSGRVFRRYSNMDATPIIHYVNDQVAHGISTDLIILREFITSMGGIVSDVDFTEAQLFALSGGELLRRQTLISLGDKRYESAKSATRLMKALVQTDLACRLLTNMAQYRQSAIYRLPEGETHIKYLANVIDDSQQALVQYVELLRTNLPPEQFDALIPSIPRLMTDFGLDANLAFMIGRASLQYFMMGPGEKLAITSSESPKDADGDMIIDTKDNDGVPSSVTQDAEDQMLVDVPDTEGTSPPQLPLAVNGQKSDRFMDVLAPIVNAARALLPSDVWDKISPEFFVLFWSLQTGDLVVPMASYDAETARVEKQYVELKRDRSDMSMSNKKKSLDALIQINKDLAAEASACRERVSKTKILLIKQSTRWFSSSAKGDSIADTFIEECLMPRILLSPGDADFCHRMIKFMHSNRVANFRLLDLYDRFFGVNRLRLMIFGCTVREAEFLGRFIKLTLGDLARWHKDKETYAKEAIQNGKLGFATAFDDNGKPTSFMEHDQFRDLLWTWHRNLSAALRACLTGMEWMHIRNAITVLKACLEHFPAVDFMGRQFLQILGKIAEREAASKNEGEDGQNHRVDLSVTANTATSALKRYSPKWVMVQAFRSNISGDSTEDKKFVESSKTVQASSSLRASAPEFKPTPAGSTTQTKANAEEEDGEVKDIKVSSGVDSAKEDSRSTPSSNKDTTQKPPATLQKPDSKPIPSRSSTPRSVPTAPAPAPGPRVEPSRPSTLAPAPGLPSRPEVPFPAHFTHDKFGQITTSAHPRDHREPRDTRDPREPRGPRDSRDVRDPRDSRDQRSFSRPDDSRAVRGRDPQVIDRRAPESIPREPLRSERDRPPHRPDSTRRNESNPPDRDGRTPRDRPAPPSSVNRGPETTRPQRDSSVPAKPMLPPPQPEPQGPTVNPDRARLINADRPDERSGVNPARAALIGDVRPTGRQLRDESRDRNGSRPVSPRRSDRPDSRSGDLSRDDRSGRPHRVDHQPRDHWTESLPSTGPKGGRFNDHEGDRGMPDRSREPMAFQGPPLSARGEPEHGRLNNQDPDYGRLSSIPSIGDTANPPEGPRGRGRTSARAPANPLPGQPDPRFSSSGPHRPPSPDRHHPPTGPASSRPRRGQPGGQYSHGNGPAASPGTTSSPGIHPERLRQLNPGASGVPASSSQSSYAAPAPSPVPVHPDRMGQIAPSSSGPHQGGRSALPPLQTSDRPPIPVNSGHRQPSGNHPMGPGPEAANIMSAPTGPSSSNERARTGGRRQLSGINNILSGGSPTVRTRGSRTNLAGSDAQVLTGASPHTTPVHERPDPNILSNERSMNGSERSGRNDHERGRRDHSNADRSLRSSRRSSRDHTPERDQRPKDHRDYRERKSNTGPPNHGREGEMEPPRRSGRDPAVMGRELLPPGSRGDLMGNGRDGPRESRHRGDGGGRHDDYGRGRGGGGAGGGPRGGDDRRESRGDDRGRKRRSDEYGGPGSEKRQRR